MKTNIINPSKELVKALNLKPQYTRTCNSSTCCCASHDSGYFSASIEVEEIDSASVYTLSGNFEYGANLLRTRDGEYITVYHSAYAGTFDRSYYGRSEFFRIQADAEKAEEKRRKYWAAYHAEKREAEEKRIRDWDKMESQPEYKIIKKALEQGRNPCKVLRNLGYKNVTYKDEYGYPEKGTVIVLNPRTGEYCTISFQE